MKRKSKYQRKNKKSRDCRDCKKFGGYIGKNYFICKAEMFEEDPHCHDIYDRDVLKTGTCNLFVPKEVDQDEDIHSRVSERNDSQT